MASLPVVQGVVDKILDALLELITLKLQTDISTDDASRLQTIKVGPRQDDPAAVVILIHENDPEDPRQWPHFPLRYPEVSQSGNLIGRRNVFGGEGETAQVRSSHGYELIGGGSRVARAFTLEVEIWGDEVSGANLERRDAGQLAAIVEHRMLKALREAGPKIGQDDVITDDFGESVQLGPHFGDGWTDQEEGEALIVRKYVRVYYVCSQDWNTTGW